MKNNLFSTLVVNKNFFKKSLFLVLACCLSYSALGATIYSTDIVESPTGATIAGNKGEFTSAPSWASECSNCFKTTGSAGAITITFDEPLNLSGYNNCQLILTWGAESNRPVNVSINDDSASEIDKVGSAAERSTVRNAKMDLAVNSISSIKISGSGGGQSYYFHIEIISDGESSGGGDTPGEDPQDEGEPVVQSFSFPNMVSGTDVYDEENLAIKAKIKFGSDRTNIKPTFKGKNISDNWDPASANFEENETQEFTFTYTKSGKVKNYSVTILEAEKEPEPSGDEEWLIKGTSQQEATGPAAGSVETNLSKKDEVKLDKKKYFGLILENGYVLQENDVFVINISTAADLGKCMLFADKDGQELLYDEGVEYSKEVPSATGEKTIVLPAAVEGKSAIYLWREDGTTQWNPTFNYIGIKRDGIEIITVAVTGVSLDQTSIPLEEGKSATLNATVEPSNATDKSVSWSSSDEGVAKVDNNGKVTAVAAGTATITVTTNNGGFTDSCKVSVTKADTPEPPTPSGDACANLYVAAEGDTPAKDAEVALKPESTGGKIIFESAKDDNFEASFKYTEFGLQMSKGKADFVRVVLENELAEGTVITLRIHCSNEDGKERGFKIQTVEKQDVFTAAWSFESDPVSEKDFSYTVKADDGLVGQSAFFVVRNESAILNAVIVSNCGGETPPPSGDVPVTGVKLDKSEQEVKLEVGGSITLNATVEPTNATNKNVIWSTDKTEIATIDKETGKVTAEAVGTAKAIVTTEDGEFSDFCYITVIKEDIPDIPVPQTDLSLHVPGVYEAKAAEGGYDAELTPFNNREYEVYYINRDGSSNLSIAISNADKSGSICDNTKATEKSTVAQDGWVKISDSNGTGGDTNAGAKDEFGGSIRSVKFNSESHELVMHIKGYDQFSFYGKDNNKDASKNKMFVLYIDTVKQKRTPQEYAINRFDISTGEHVIRLTAVGGSDSKLCSFSLRVAQEPRIKYFKGNDSTQVVLQTTDIKPIRYTTKYNDIDGAEIKLEFDRTASATGIELTTLEGGITDTIVLSGKAMCPVGEYHYSVVSYLNGKETSRADGAFSVISQIVSVSEINVTADQGEEMDPINFYYYALSPEDVQVNWPNGEPGGTVKGHGTEGTGYNYVIDGKPENVGQFPFKISVLGADTVITGLITVESSELGPNPVLYLFKNTYENDGVFEHLKKNWSPKPKKALDQLREPEEYAKYKLVVISEDADADNKEVLELARGGAAIPILNLNGFSYAERRLEWGDPSNGSVDTVTNNGCKVYIERDDHPIFQSFKGRNSIQVFSELVAKKGVMPIDVTLQGTQCLATAYTRNIMDYYKDGEKQTVIHEIPARMRGEQKYICFPISRATSAKLTPDGKNLLDAILAYLMDQNASPVFNPDLQIHHFSLQGHDGIIDQTENTITIEITDREFMALDSLRAVKPSITLAESKYVHITPSRDKEQDFRFSFYMPIVYTVSDYINRLSYSVSVRVKSTQGIEDVYAPGDWVNVFDIYGRKVATTNEDIYSMSLSHGMYIVVTESGETLKIMR